MMYADIILQTYDAYLAEQSHIIPEEESSNATEDGAHHWRKQRYVTLLSLYCGIADEWW